MLIESGESLPQRPAARRVFCAPKGLQASSEATARAASGTGGPKSVRGSERDRERAPASGRTLGAKPRPLSVARGNLESRSSRAKCGAPAFLSAQREKKKGQRKRDVRPQTRACKAKGARLRRPGFPGCPAVAGGAMAVRDIAGVQPAKRATAAFSRARGVR